MKIYATSQSDFDRFVGKDLWVLTWLNMNLYWLKILSKTYTDSYFKSTRIAVYKYCWLMTDSIDDTDVYSDEDVMIFEDDLRGHKLVQPITVKTTEELFGENVDPWWEGR